MSENISIETIKKPIAEYMDLFEPRFRLSMKSKVALLDRITHYIIKRKGKQLRPMFVFLSAKLTGSVNDSTYNAASLIELLHTATLVHDDVVDDAAYRRGFFSLNALWKNKVAVLVGDYLLSKGLLMAIDNKEFQLLQIVSNAVREMSEGELLQMEKTRTLNIEESVYFDIIRMKTAVLIAACCAAGVASTGASENQIERARMMGEKAGIAFQIKDDLFDFGLGKKTGKPTGVDIKEKKTTLPLIYALNNASGSKKGRIINIVKSNSKNDSKINEVMQFVFDSGGIEYSQKLMEQYTNEALAILDEFEDNAAKTSLRQLIKFTIEREK